MTRISHSTADFAKQLLSAAKGSLTPAAVFDIDSTLLSLWRRTSKIIESFQQDAKFRRLYPKQCEQLLNAKVLPEDWGIHEPIKRAGVHFDENSEFYRHLIGHWREGFFSNNYLEHDEPLPGAVEFVQKLQAMGFRIQYLTGRDIPRMQSGTLISLKNHGFPVENTDIILKPHRDLDDAEFKTNVLASHREKFGPIWFFENEPLNLVPVAEKLPDIKLVFLDTTHSGKATPPAGAIHIGNFVDLVAHLK